MSGDPPAAENVERAGALPVAIADALPAAVVFFEPGTARVLYANEVARTVAGGVLARPRSPDEYGVSYRCFDLAGNPVALEQMPGVRGSRGEIVRGQQVVWDTPHGRQYLRGQRRDGAAPRRSVRGRDDLPRGHRP